MSKSSKISFIFCILLMLTYVGIHLAVILGYVQHNREVSDIGFICFLVFTTFFSIIVRDTMKKNKINFKQNQYTKKLNEVLIAQSHNQLFYDGKLSTGSKELTREVANSLNIDRCSIWLYDQNKESIVCQQLYLKDSDSFDDTKVVLFEKDFLPYFEALKNDTIIVASDAENNPATSCFIENYLRPLKIKSMLDVPIIFRGEAIGVICIENFEIRNWNKTEINFVQMLSSLYSFGYSIKEINKQKIKFEEMTRFIDEASLISKADAMGNITYVNEKFTKISGYSENEVLGKNHNIVNSGVHPKSVWQEMYNTVINKKKIWNMVITNKRKDGNLYYVDTYIKGEFDTENDDKLVGFTSIRQDVTDLKLKEQELRNRMDAINKSSAVIEFNLDGKILFSNEHFANLLGYTTGELKGKNHKILVDKDFAKSDEYQELWDKLKSGDYFSNQVHRITKDGRSIWLQATYNPIKDIEGNVYSVMKIASDITDYIKKRKEIEKKNTYLEHAAKILRHDMHSGINTYIPRGLSSLERRLTEEQIRQLKIEAPLKMIKEGLKHSQKVYRGVYEFTNLVKKDACLNKQKCNLSYILDDYLKSTAYRGQVVIEELGEFEVNESLFCTAIDNLIRNGLRYNDSETKMVKIYRKKDVLYVEDNGRGMSKKDFETLQKPYVRKTGQKESGSGLGLNICISILEEHGFSISCDKLRRGGTQLKINLKK